jgi:hypothetical protein
MNLAQMFIKQIKGDKKKVGTQETVMEAVVSAIKKQRAVNLTSVLAESGLDL